MVETLLVIGVCSLYMLAMGNISSVQYPRGLNPERVSQGGASSRFQALVFLLYPLSLLPVFLAYLARYAFESEFAFYLVLALAAASAARSTGSRWNPPSPPRSKRRERIIRDLSTADGPIASDSRGGRSGQPNASAHRQPRVLPTCIIRAHISDTWTATAPSKAPRTRSAASMMSLAM